MGSFAGHIDEAVFFLIIALWWMWHFFMEYIRATRSGKPFTSKLSFSWPSRHNIPIEAIFKALFPAVGFLAEVLNHHTSFVDEKGNFRGLINLQHMSIYGLFVLHGLIDIAMSTSKIPLPKGTDYMSLVLCLLWYGLSFQYHVLMHGKEGMETVIHVLPTYVMFLAALVLVIEYWKPHAFMATASRIFCTLMLGTWFFHASFILYQPSPFPGNNPNPNWDHHDDRNSHFLVALFGYHAIFNLFIMVITYIGMYILTSVMYKRESKVASNGSIPLLTAEDPMGEDADF